LSLLVNITLLKFKNWNRHGKFVNQEGASLRDLICQKKDFLMAFVLVIVLQWFVITFADETFSTSKLKWQQHLACFTIAFMGFIVVIIARRIQCEKATKDQK